MAREAALVLVMVNERALSRAGRPLLISVTVLRNSELSLSASDGYQPFSWARSLHKAASVKSVGSRTLALACLLGLVGTGCGQSSASDSSATGRVARAFEISPGVTVSSASYTIDGPGDFVSAGTVAVGASPDVPITVSVPVGNGYVIDVTALASDGTQCGGSTTFDVTGTGPTTVVVHLVCDGAVEVSGSINVCPVLDGVGASPAESLVGGTIALSALAHDADNGPAALTYRWFANMGSLSRQLMPTLTFTCTSAGLVTVAGRVSDGACTDSLSVSIRCTP